jgi:hypothetical protein
VNKQVHFYDIYGYVHTPFWKTKIFITSMLVISTILIALLSYVLYKQYKKRQAEKKPELQPWQKAIEMLKKLTPEKYETKEKFKKFYFQISHIFKSFLQEQFGWDVLEKTDDELINFLREKNFDENLVKNLKSILEGSLLIKFANEQALKEQARKDLDLLISIIKTQKTIE